MTSPWDALVDSYDSKKITRRLWIRDDVYVAAVQDLFNVGGTLLDVGCGAGSISLPLSTQFRVHSLDFSRSMLDRVRVRAKESGREISAVHADSGQIPFKDHVFDGTLCKFALWPVPDPEETMREMVRVTKKDGTIVIVEVDRKQNGYTLSLRSKAIYRAYIAIKRLDGWDHTHTWKVIRETTEGNPKINLDFAKDVLENCGCEIIHVDTSIKERISGVLSRMCGDVESNGYFLIGAKK